MVLNQSTTRRSQKLLTAALEYIDNAFGAQVTLKDKANPKVPYFILDRYLLISAELWGSPLIFAIPRGNSKQEVSTKILKSIETFTSDLVVLLAERLTPRDRKILIKCRQAFLVPNTQLYLPQMATDFREKFGADHGPQDEHLSPTAQLIVLAKLLGHHIDGQTASSLARRYQYSAMGTNRAIDELERYELATLERRGRSRHIVITRQGLDLWQAALPYLRSPILKMRNLTELPDAGTFYSGESALARYTLLAEPNPPVLATASGNWKFMAKYLSEATPWEQRAAQLETWSYNPAALSDGKTVDRLSLWLCLRDNQDPRIQEAADQLLERVTL